MHICSGSVPTVQPACPPASHSETTDKYKHDPKAKNNPNTPQNQERGGGPAVLSGALGADGGQSCDDGPACACRALPEAAEQRQRHRTFSSRGGQACSTELTLR